jgi:hypothetical protein
MLDVVRPEFNNKYLNEISTLSRQLSDKVFELDPNMERNIKFKRELDHLLAPYTEIHKELEKKKKQTSIKTCFVSSNTRVNLLFKVGYCSYGNSVATLHQLHRCRLLTAPATS